jgi:hypothetical protein
MADGAKVFTSACAIWLKNYVITNEQRNQLLIIRNSLRSDANLADTSLKEALQSDFLKNIRDSDEHLHETEGGCALWIKREWVRSLHRTHTAG